MRISVIIPAINEAKYIQRAIASCWDAGFDEVIVTDGGSSDGTYELACQMNARVVLGLPGRATQQNLGAAHASGDVLLFLHADNWLAVDAGTQLRKYLTNESTLAGAFKQHIDAPGILFRLIEWGNAARVHIRGAAYGDQAIFMRREVFDRIGGFPQVELMEDLLLMRSFRKVGRMGLLPGPIHVSPRRWKRHGTVRQTLRNWSLVVAAKLGVSPHRLRKFYPDHSELTNENAPKVQANECQASLAAPEVAPSADQ